MASSPETASRALWVFHSFRHRSHSAFIRLFSAPPSWSFTGPRRGKLTSASRQASHPCRAASPARRIRAAASKNGAAYPLFTAGFSPISPAARSRASPQCSAFRRRLLRSTGA